MLMVQARLHFIISTICRAEHTLEILKMISQNNFFDTIFHILHRIPNKNNKGKLVGKI